ncbi:hypothetical protein GLOTRDRAFT_114937 [Gloeophyllum trabeum ATCC 11539]|uniref:Uncharacterized protein n=1 Tax=Gloeophyllum trabeum (strain ATCC 11539 / FP-39264 / Madison 617) TaxID=670483 RepID=S7QHB3_GLOTA|nr:uncharacterized protein GLOTRDRAFT_114937 [Gloeophyllum trabeum ATCC 11539]EPQ58552.1 hypothetical protein GLOTRDRAFT_114937 [Gloeophyllum trabeum ATCC 11539]
MAPAPVDTQRPSMRRKSSAQNLLASFKGAPPGPPPPIATASLSNAGHSYTGTPTTSTPVTREWDVQSMGSDGVPSAVPTAGASPALGTATSVEYLRDLLQKRIITLTYMRNVHDGRSHWFHTIMMSRAELDRVFNNTAMKKRTYRFAILGMSLSTLFDIQQPQDLLRGLLNTLNEFENMKEGEEKSRVRLFSRSRMSKRQAGAVSDYAISYSDSSDNSYLVIPHMPFPLDYHQTLLSLLDVLSELYNKILRFLGPSPFPNAQHMLGPLGALSPHPGVSYLFSQQAEADPDNGLWGIANAHGGPGSQGPFGGTPGLGGLGSPPPSWTPGLGESVLKIDGKLKKITSTLLKELDTFARNSIKDELSSLDPLLRNVDASVAEEGREQYDFEGSVE